ncbi:MAG: exonuclease domain-containing protein [Hyphomicrobiaceae bacterium]
MRMRIIIPLALMAAWLPGQILAVVLATSMGRRIAADAETIASLNAALSIGFALGLVVFLAVWAVLHMLIVAPATALAREAQRVAVTPSDREIAVHNPMAMGGLVTAVAGLGRALAQSHQRTDEAIAAAAGDAEAQKRRLEAILLDLEEGVIVCNREHRIILYNEAARRILRLREATGLGRSLFGLLARDPIVHTFELLQRGNERGPQESRRFMVSTLDLGTLIETRMGLVREASGETSGYVLSFQDIGAQIESLSTRDTLLREVMVDWRRPIANLSAAIETFAGDPDLGAAERAGFEEILRKEISFLSARFQDAARRIDRLDMGFWGIADLHSVDLFRAVERTLGSDSGASIRLVGLPTWISADSHALTLLLVHLARKIAASSGAHTLDLGVSRGSQHAYIEMGWDGEPARADVLDVWLDEPIKGAVASRTARQIIERHGGEAWCLRAADGTALLRIPIRPAARATDTQQAEASGPRPEYYDFDLIRPAPASMADARLREIRYVVFDTETTGLQPSLGDKLLSIGGVQVVNGRLLTTETFERLNDPERDIPAASTRIHGITAEMVQGKPPARIVLPQFHAFAHDAVLVAYNIAFDMKFLTLQQDEAGVAFDNPVIDALLLAIHVFPELPDPSLSAMARFLDIEVTHRHTALGDALVTAEIWLRLIEGLERKGVTTFGEALAISSRLVAERRLSDKF